MFKRIATLAVISALAAAPALAEHVTFSVNLASQDDTAATKSKATGKASILVDSDKQTIDLKIDIKGMKTADLASGLSRKPIGPIHLHNYLTNGDVVLVLPVPFGPSYADTPAGFSVNVKAEPYAENAAKVQSKLTFAEFLAAMNSGSVVLNVHTNAFGDGEISGKVYAVRAIIPK